MAAAPTFPVSVQPPARYDWNQAYTQEPAAATAPPVPAAMPMQQPQAFSQRRPLPQVPQPQQQQHRFYQPHVPQHQYQYYPALPQPGASTFQGPAVVHPPPHGAAGPIPPTFSISSHQHTAPPSTLPQVPVQPPSIQVSGSASIATPPRQPHAAQVGAVHGQTSTPPARAPLPPIPGAANQRGPVISVGVHDAPSPPQINVAPAISVVAPSVPEIPFGSPTQGAGPSIKVPQAPAPPAKNAHSHTSEAQSSSSHHLTAADGSTCASCHRLIVGRVINAMSQLFHPTCFQCKHCHEPLEHVAFFEHEGAPYCHLDYHELFSTRCFHCRTPIVDERYITINDPDLVGGKSGGTEGQSGGVRNYHEMHFFCAQCGDPFLDPNAAGSVAGANPNANLVIDEDGRVQHGGKAFVVHKGYPYCEGCHNRLHKPRCRKCKNPILTDEIINALGHKWHPNCFVCESCQQPFESSSIFVNKGKAYDEHCYTILLRQML
ncbi:hypothetical protein OC861_004886 [Tilletia horrida]|nr:hypothetical protein OC861_004886 [Tilletia horrida]